MAGFLSSVHVIATWQNIRQRYFLFTAAPVKMITQSHRKHDSVDAEETYNRSNKTRVAGFRIAVPRICLRGSPRRVLTVSTLEKGR